MIYAGSGAKPVTGVIDARRVRPAGCHVRMLRHRRQPRPEYEASSLLCQRGGQHPTLHEQQGNRLPPLPHVPHALAMFVVTEADAAAIRAAFARGGELSAAVELRRLFPGVTSTMQAQEFARAIAGWKPLPAPPLRRVKLLRPSKGR
jgi:hypothetical protein